MTVGGMFLLPRPSRIHSDLLSCHSSYLALEGYYYSSHRDAAKEAFTACRITSSSIPHQATYRMAAYTLPRLYATQHHDDNAKTRSRAANSLAAETAATTSSSFRRYGLSLDLSPYPNRPSHRPTGTPYLNQHQRMPPFVCSCG